MVARRQQWGIKMSDLMTHKERKRVLGGEESKKITDLVLAGVSLRISCNQNNRKKKDLCERRRDGDDIYIKNEMGGRGGWGQIFLKNKGVSVPQEKKKKRFLVFEIVTLAK